MAKSKTYGMSEQQKYLEQRKRNKVNKRHNSISGKSKCKGERAWLKVRRRVGRKLLDR